MTLLIPLSQGKYALVDEQDYGALSVYKWYYNNGYAYAVLESGAFTSMHRILLFPSSCEVVDHINHNGLDNRRSNIRICSVAENVYNNSGKTASTSCYKGVSFSTKKKYWRMQIYKDGEQLEDMRFYSEIAAANSYNFFATRHFGEYAFLNDVPAMVEDEWRKLLVPPPKVAQVRSGHKHIAYNGRREKWMVYHDSDGRRKYLGTFAQLSEAISVRDAYFGSINN